MFAPRPLAFKSPFLVNVPVTLFGQSPFQTGVSRIPAEIQPKGPCNAIFYFASSNHSDAIVGNARQLWSR